jgi:large subunit ribosomal protein L30
MAKLRIKQVRSTIGQRYNFERTLRSLGLRRINHSVIHDDTPSIRGMVHSVQHLVSVELEAGEEE